MKKAFDFFLFSSLYIALCALLMIYQTCRLIMTTDVPLSLYLFVFFSTICSYNFHWWLSTNSVAKSDRVDWSKRHRNLQFFLFIAGAVGAGIVFVDIARYWLPIAFSVFLTFLYSAPKLPYKPFLFLRKIAVGKTIFLAMVWTYVTTVLPLLVSGQSWTGGMLLFCISRFMLIYAICIIFDYRDREDDRADGIRSMITYFNDRGIDNLFALSMILFLVSTVLLLWWAITPIQLLLLLVPGMIVVALYHYSKRHFSDYLYYFVLDGLMMLSSLLMLVLWI
ncbi:MAG: UbiA family prenyltransferase [Gemmatimonadaceae bacterium]|nr:UbiA family prenyltransferase [Chitinophagaceae bacterium]